MFLVITILRAKLLKKNDIRNSYRYFPKKKLHPRRSAAEKGDCFFSCIAFSKFITGISFFQLFHYLTVEDSHSGTIDVVVKTTSGGIAPTIYIE